VVAFNNQRIRHEPDARHRFDPMTIEKSSVTISSPFIDNHLCHYR
jgi:hypothetical protein